MSARRETEKRLRPRNSPYRRNHFDKSKYLRVPMPGYQEQPIAENEESNSLQGEIGLDTSIDQEV